MEKRRAHLCLEALVAGVAKAVAHGDEGRAYAKFHTQLAWRQGVVARGEETGRGIFQQGTAAFASVFHAFSLYY